MLAAVAAFVGFCLNAKPVPAQMMQQQLCGKRGEIAVKLRSEYQETVAAMGLTNSGTVIEVFTSPKGSFTIVMTHPNGLACLMAAGESWEKVEPRNTDSES